GGSGSGMHFPARQVSLPLQKFPSLQLAPSSFGMCLHPPTALSHESVVHGSPSSQFGGGPLRQIPPPQVSTPLHALPSVQERPSGACCPAEHTPAAQVSRPLHMNPSLHGEPSGGAAPWEHTPDWQVSTPLHGSLSPQFAPFAGGGPAVHWPAWQVSRPL